MGFVDVKTEEYRVEWAGRHYTVISPRTPLTRVFVTSYGQSDWQIWADTGGFGALAKWMMLSANFPHAVVFIRKSNDRIAFLPGREPHDLIVTGHQCQLKASRWVEIRARLGKGLLSTRLVAIPDPNLPMPPVFRYEPAADPVDVREHARTVFIVSSKPTFRYMSGLCESLKSCKATGDHQHLFGLMRNRGRTAEDDLTLAYAESDDWATS